MPSESHVGSSAELPHVAEIHTIGHGNREFSAFVALLQRYSIDTLVDVRTQPWSKFAPQFGQAAMQVEMQRAGIKYVFMGKELGGRPTGDEFYDPIGRVYYDRLAESRLFLEGIDILLHQSRARKIAIMCSESDHKVCHRYLLVGEILFERGARVVHIDAKGGLEQHVSIFPDSLDMLFEIEERPEWKSLRSVRQEPTDGDSLRT